jgi:Na+-transporting NADH:ubiquinone oxidoreductase subunit NqrB
MILKDARDYQILFLSLFLALGIATRDWSLRPLFIVVTILSCLLTQWLLYAVTTNSSPLALPSFSFLRSALITSLGLSLLLRADHWTTMAIAGFVAIASKFIFKVGDKHFFNPANFGIISALVITPDAWVSPGQWGEEWWYGLLFAGAGGLILKKVGRWDTTAAFLFTYGGLEAVRNVWLGWTWDVYFHRLMSGSLLLFALFMVTDPRSIPNARVGRIIWAMAIASLTFVLRNYFFLPTAVFWALFALAPLTILVDTFWLAPNFQWVGLDIPSLQLSQIFHAKAQRRKEEVL